MRKKDICVGEEEEKRNIVIVQSLNLVQERERERVEDSNIDKPVVVRPSKIEKKK